MEAWIKGIQASAELERRKGGWGLPTGGPRGLHRWHGVASVGRGGQGREPSRSPPAPHTCSLGVVFQQMDSAGDSESTKTPATRRLLPCSHAWGYGNPKDIIVAQRTASRSKPRFVFTASGVAWG